MKNIIENVKLVFTMGIIGALLLYIGMNVFMPDLVVDVFQFQPYVVVTESMEPVINVNDMVVVGQFDIDEAEVGDIITFKADIDYNGTDEVITHYIYSIEEVGEKTIIKTNRHFDEGQEVTPDTWLIDAEDVIGSYSFHVKYAGLLVGFFKSIYGIIIVIANVLIFGTLKFVNNRMKRKEMEQAELVAAKMELSPQNS